MDAPRSLVVVADDLGIGPATSHGILHLAALGKVTATVLLVNSPHAEAAVRRLLAEGAARARETSAPTLAAMYERMGFALPAARQAGPGLASGTRRL